MISLQLSRPTISPKALAWTVGTHALLLLLFFFFTYTIPPTPPPPPADTASGLQVELGTTETGSGAAHPRSRKDPAEYRAAVVFRSVESKAHVPENIVKSNEADAPEIDKESKKKGKEDNDDKKHAHEVPKFVYKGSTGQGGNSAPDNAPGANAGSTSGKGDQGTLNGSPDANSATGSPGNGSGGIGHNLTGRSISPRTFEAEFHESGKVIIHVTVDRNGNIIDKRVVSSSSPQLTRIALEKLATARFNKSTSLEPEQHGDVTITFKTRQ